MNQAALTGILEEFNLISQIPHGSLNEEKLCAYLMKALENLGYSPECDEFFNIRCDIPASKGCESAPLTILQAHMDMVCVAAAGVSYDPINDPIQPILEGRVLKTDGSTSLGADNSMAIAVILHLLKTNTLPSHGPLRILFTSAEEIGLVGAAKMSPEWLDGCSYLINTDGFSLDSVIVCSGGNSNEVLSRKLNLSPAKKSCAYTITLDGFAGGHSGFNIHEGRGNPIVLLGRFLASLRKHISFELSHISGGSAPNAIPCNCMATIVFDDCDIKMFRSLCDAFFAELELQYRRTSPSASFAYAQAAIPNTVFSNECKDSLLNLIMLYFNGVESQNPYFPDITGTSSNLGVISISDSNEIILLSRTRYLLDHSALQVSGSHRCAAELCGFSYSKTVYPSHIGNPDSFLTKLADKAHRHVCGAAAIITATHVGLEASEFARMRPEIEIVTIGMDISNAHSPAESVCMDSVLKFKDMMNYMISEISNL